MPVKPLFDHAKKSGISVFHRSLPEELIPTDDDLEDLLALTEVVMIGYPRGLWDSKNNLPLIRRGITAIHPSIDFDGQAKGCVDIAALHGSSGSPIIIFDGGCFSTRAGTSIGTRTMLLGVLFGGPMAQTDGRIDIVEIPTASLPVAITPIPIHLGYYEKARELKPLKNTLFKKFNLR